MLSLIPAKAPWPFERNVAVPFDPALWSQFSFSENLFVDEASDTLVAPASGVTLSKYKMTNTAVDTATLDKIPPVYFTATEDYTIEGWVNLSSVSAYGGTILTIDNLGVGGDGNRSFMLSSFQSGSLLYPYFFVSSTGNSPTPGTNTLSGNTGFALNTDTHVAVCRKAGIVTMYLNGKIVGTVADTTAGYRSAEFMSVRRGALGKRWGMRVLRGKAAYTAAFTPGRLGLPLAQYYDAATQKDVVFQACMRRNALINEVNRQPITLEGTATVANSRLITTATNASRFSAYCQYFGASDFTVECRVRMPVNPATAESSIIGQYGNAFDQYCSWLLWTGSSRNLIFYWVESDGTQRNIAASVSLALNSDVHVVVERSNGQITMYFDGVAVATGTSTKPIIDRSTLRPLRNAWDNTTGTANTLQVTNIRIAKRAMYKGVVAPSSSLPRIKSAATGPGPQTLKYGTPYLGYYGQVTETDLLGTADLATLVGITEGTKNANTVWLKFASKGKVLFIPKTYIRDQTSWQSVYAAGCVYGLDTGTGLSPSGTAVQQTKRVQLNGSTFRVRLPTGANANPYPGAASEYNLQDPDNSQNSEWSLLMYRIWANDPSGTSWEAFTNAELGVVGNRLDLCQETHPYAATHRVQRGYLDVPGLAASAANSPAAAGYYAAWRPVLEFVTSDETLIIKADSIADFESVGVVTEGVGQRFTTNTYLKSVANPAFIPGTGDFTIEVEFTVNSLYNGGNGVLVPLIYWGVFAAPGQGINYELHYNNDSKGFTFSATYNTAGEYYTAPFTLALATAYKLQVTREAGVLAMWVNGTKIGQVAFTKDIQMTANTPMYIGRRIGGTSGQVSWWADMNVKNFRFVLRGLSKL